MEKHVLIFPDVLRRRLRVALPAIPLAPVSIVSAGHDPGLVEQLRVSDRGAPCQLRFPVLPIIRHGACDYARTSQPLDHADTQQRVCT